MWQDYCVGQYKAQTTGVKTITMAIITSKGALTGLVGQVVLRHYQGRTVLQSRPGRIRQTPAMRGSAAAFGRASATAKKIRLAVSPLLREGTDSGLYRRFASAVYAAALAGHQGNSGRSLENGDLSLLRRFQFNAASPMEHYCRVATRLEPLEGGRLKLVLPACEAALSDMPANTSSAELCFLVCVLDPAGWTVSHEAVFRAPALPSGGFAGGHWTSEALPQGHIAFVLSALLAYRNERLLGSFLLNSKAWHPCELVEVVRI